MRWWLALAFAGIAALTALAVAQVFTARSESAIHDRAQELVAGAAVAAAARIPPQATARRSDIARRSSVRPGISRSSSSPETARSSLHRERVALLWMSCPTTSRSFRQPSTGRRSVESIDDGRLVTVAIPMQRLHAAALIAVASPSDLQDALGIVRNEIVYAALWATAIGAIAGLVVALLITRRLRRIAAAAAEIERGGFDHQLTPRFPDELGALARTIDHMRVHLRSSFERLEEERHRLQRLLEQLQEGVGGRRQVANCPVRELACARPSEPRSRARKALPDPWPTLSLHEAVALAVRRERRADYGQRAPGDRPHIRGRGPAFPVLRRMPQRWWS